jgi:hypothetical protein
VLPDRVPHRHRPAARLGRTVDGVGASATLSQDALSAAPGGEAAFEVRVRNSGSVVDLFTFEVLGDASAWATVEPPTISLFPGADGAVRVRFAVPRSSDVPTGDVPFAVRVVSKEDVEGSIVEEGTLQVGAFADLFAEISPRTSRGRRAATHELSLDNRGNSRIEAALTASDPDQLLSFALHPPALVAPPGTATFSKVTVQPRKPFWRGQPQTRPFQVKVAPEGQPPLTVDATMLQEPLIPKWFFKALGLALALLLLLFVLWLTLLKPTVQSAARNAVEKPLAQTNAAVSQTGQAVKDLAEKVGAPPPSIDSPGPTDGGGADGSKPGTGTNGGTPFDRRLAVNGAGAQEDSFKVADDKALSLTDVVFQNPAGDSGTLELRRGDMVLFRVNLANFRDLDYHFVSPIIAGSGTRVTMRVQCSNPPGQQCSPAMYLTGFAQGPT